MWGPKKIFARFAREFLLKHSAAYGEGTDERGEAEEGKGRQNAKKHFRLLPDTNPVYATVMSTVRRFTPTETDSLRIISLQTMH